MDFKFKGNYLMVIKIIIVQISLINFKISDYQAIIVILAEIVLSYSGFLFLLE